MNSSRGLTTSSPGVRAFSILNERKLNCISQRPKREPRCSRGASDGALTHKETSAADRCSGNLLRASVKVLQLRAGLIDEHLLAPAFPNQISSQRSRSCAKHRQARGRRMVNLVKTIVAASRKAHPGA